MAANLRLLRDLYIRSYKNWSDDNASRLAAALSFYAILALAPLLVLAIAIVSHFLDAGSVKTELLDQAREAIGPNSVEFLNTLISNASKPTTTAIASLLSLGVALSGASGLFWQLYDAINTIWGLGPPKGSVIKHFLWSRFVSTLMVLIFAALVLAWMIFDSILGYVSRTTGSFPGSTYMSVAASTAFLTGVFALAFKTMPRGMVAWRDVWIAAVTTGVGFAISKFLLSLYFTYSGVSTAYGSAGALVVILLWIYYSAQVFFFGVEVTYTYAHHYGSQTRRGEHGAKMS